MKRFVLLVSLIFVFSFSVLSAPIYKYEETEPITESVTLTRVNEFYSDHNISYSYIKMDLTDKRVKLDLLKSDNGTDIMDTVKNLAESNESTVAAINADFFSAFSGNKGFSLGIEKVDGNVLQSPIYPDTMATVAYDGESVLMSYLDFHVMVVAPDWEYSEVRHINKHTTYYGEILMYTSTFNGGYSPAPGGNVVEVVVEDNKIVEFRRNMEPCLIPENGCVLVVSEGSSMFFANHFSVGDEVKFDWYVTPSLDDYDLAFGGGSMLVKEGQDVGKIGDYTHTVAGNHPRSAIGIDEEGKTLYLVAVDGRQTSSLGMRMSRLAELLIELGCYNAVNLDGGGSTNLVASTLWQSGLHSVNSPTENRRVINAVGIVLDDRADKQESDEDSESNQDEENEEDEEIVSGIKLRPDKDVVYVGEKITFEAVVHDENMRRVEFDESNLDWYCSEGEILDGVLMSDVGGEITVGVSYEDVSRETSVYVVEKISGIVTPDSFRMNVGEERKIEISVFDAAGRFVNVSSFADFEIISSNESVISVEDNKIYAKGDGTATVTVSKDGLESSIGVAVGHKKVDYTYEFEYESGYFTSYPSGTKGDYGPSERFAASGKYSGKLEYDFTDDIPSDEDASDEEVENSEDAEKAEEVQDVSKAVYFALNYPVVFDNSCSKVDLKAYTENNFAHEIRVQISDADGSMRYLKTTSSLEKNQWNELSFEIPEDVKRPAKLSRVYVLYTPGEEKDSGSVFLDDLSFVTAEDYEIKNSTNDGYITKHNNSNITSQVRITALADENVKNPVAIYNRTRLELENEYKQTIAISENTKNEVFEDENALYISLDTSKNGIRNSGSSQWDKIVSAVNSTQKETVILISNQSIFGTDEFENRVITDYLASIGKNVFVVSRGNKASFMNIKNVSYITLDSNPEMNISLSREKRKNSVVFTFGDIVTFDFA